MIMKSQKSENSCDEVLENAAIHQAGADYDKAFPAA